MDAEYREQKRALDAELKIKEDSAAKRAQDKMDSRDWKSDIMN